MKKLTLAIAAATVSLAALAGCATLAPDTRYSSKNGPADEAVIADTFRPYLEARDWVSINRGKVINFDDR